MRSALTGLILLAGAGVSAGQQLAPADARPVEIPPTAAEALLVTEPAVGQHHRLGVQVQFGYPTGLRLQYALAGTGDCQFLLEGFAGGRSAFWGDEAVFGIGGRGLFTLTHDGHNDALLFGPGIGVSYWQGEKYRHVFYDYVDGVPWVYNSRRPDHWYLNVDFTLGWLHEFTPNFGWELGLYTGALIGLSGDKDGGESVSGRVKGVIGLYTGLRY